MRLALVTIAVVFLAWAVPTGAEPPSPTITRLRAENARLRWRNRNLLATIDTLFKRMNQLESDLTDCVLKLPPPVGP